MSSRDGLASKIVAKKKLQNLRKDIEKNEPKEIDMKILNPSDKSGWKMIKHFPKMSKEVKERFRKYLVGRYSNLSEAGPSGPPYCNVLGNKWHKLLKDSINGKEMTEYSDKHVAAAKSLFYEMNTRFGIELLESEFHLYGYMNDDSEQEVYFWRGNADAIGWYYNKWRKKSEYVIVDWKVNRDLLCFWDSKDTYGMFLHQGLLYARLLQVHLNLDYLPSVSIVPIFGDNGKDVHPGLFYDYPDECKKWINDFSWHANAPVPVPLPLHIYGRASLFNDDVLKVLLKSAVSVKKDAPLISIFKENTKAGELLEALGHDASSMRIHLLKDK